MKRIIALILCLVLAAFTLTACTSSEKESQNIPNTVTQAAFSLDAPTVVPNNISTGSGNGISVFDDNPYFDSSSQQALSEEDEDSSYSVYDQYSYLDDTNEGNVYSNYYASATVYPYAGSTPIPLDPIDKPTPTPRPKLTFEYMTYTSGSLGLSFEAPINWISDESNYGLYLLTEPISQMKDGFCCEIQISRETVSGAYSKKNLAKYVKQRMSTIAEARLSKYDPSNTANRYIAGLEGIYMNYTGTLSDGTKVGGRIIYACDNQTLYGLEIIYPIGYKDSFLDVYDQIRNTLKAY